MNIRKMMHAALMSSAALALAPVGALAQQNMDSDKNKQSTQRQTMQMHNMSDDAKAHKWREMRQNAVKASEILRGNVSTGLNPVANVTNLILSKDGGEIEYIVYKTQSPIMDFYVGDGYTSFNTVDLQTSPVPGGVNVYVDSSAPVKGPEEIKITSNEADKRLVSRVLDEQVELSSGIYEIEDLLINPKNGKITHYVIGSDPDTLFSEGRRTIRATEVAYRNGAYRSNLTMQDIDQDQPYEEDWL
ncbi:MAG: hypothetical protein CMI63_12630 [Parvularcula sp.]|nr:hypothetical protein [Parvularcula sp.]